MNPTMSPRTFIKGERNAQEERWHTWVIQRVEEEEVEVEVGVGVEVDTYTMVATASIRSVISLID